jgi:hypothetical protein
MHADLSVTLDLRSLPQGTYYVATTHEGDRASYYYPLTVQSHQSLPVEMLPTGTEPDRFCLDEHFGDSAFNGSIQSPSALRFKQLDKPQFHVDVGPCVRRGFQRTSVDVLKT